MGALDWVPWLLADTALAALIGNRLNPGSLPVSETFPAVGYLNVSDPHGYTHDGDDGLARARWQFTCWARSYAGARAVETALVNAFHAAHAAAWWDAFVDNASDEQGPEAGLWTRRVDIILWHRR